MAQKIEFIRANSLDSLAAKFNTFVEGYSADLRFIITPVGFVTIANEEGYHDPRFVLAVLVEATHKRRFEDKEAAAPGVTHAEQ